MKKKTAMFHERCGGGGGGGGGQLKRRKKVEPLSLRLYFNKEENNCGHMAYNL